MVFSSLSFLFIFLPICLLLYFNPIIKNIKFKNIILLIFSIIFYCYGALKYLYIIVFSIILNYTIGIVLNKVRCKKLILALGVIINITIFLIYKILGTITAMKTETALLPIVGPLGISFFTFQELSYIIDIYRGVIPPQKNFLKYALYITFFPQLIPGPIVRYEDIYKKIDNRKTSFDNIKSGSTNLIIGLFKKSVIADTLGVVAMSIFTGKIISYATSWLGAILIMIQFYYDFSGYSDMAIGLGEIFGFKIKRNFNYPYNAISVNDYWKRWNISLGQWFNDYLLFPICNSKIYKKMIFIFSKVFNKRVAYKLCNFIVLLILWLIIGLWHGIAINFLYLGLFYFIVISLEKNCLFIKKRKVLSRIFTLIVVTIGTVIFFSFKDNKFIFLKSLFINNKFIDNRFFLLISNYYIYIIIGIMFSFPIIKKIKAIIKNKKYYDILHTIVIFSMFLISIYYIIINGYSPFLYFNF